MPSELKLNFISEVRNLAGHAEAKLKAEILRKGLTFSGALANDLYTITRQLEGGMITELEIGFRGYGKYKDLRSMRAGTNIEALLEFVQKTGIEKFKYAGYKQGRTPKDPTKTATRIAWGIAISRMRKGTLKRKGKGWFNPIKGKVEWDFMRIIANSMAESGHKMVLAVFEENIKI